MFLMDNKTAGTNSNFASVSSEASTKPLISIVIPVFNEEDNVEKTYAELKRVAAGLEERRGGGR